MNLTVLTNELKVAEYKMIKGFTVMNLTVLTNELKVAEYKMIH